jgi:Glucose / Sorbosone dehydrogenase
MIDRSFRIRRRSVQVAASVVLAAAVLVSARAYSAESMPQPLRSDISVRKILSTAVNTRAIRLAVDPRDNTLYYAKRGGGIFRVDLAAQSSDLVYSITQHGLANAQGFVIDKKGTMYIVGNSDVAGNQTKATIVKGVIDAGTGARVWSVLAETEPYPKSNTPYDHRLNGIAVGPDGAWIFVNSGSRTDHGEIQSAGGLYPGLREVGLTACILRVRTSASNVLLKNDRAWLKSNGYVYAEGTRNSFDLAFAPNGDLFGTENGPSSDASEELNWLRPGRHYGFPWRFGGAANPQQFATYDPTADPMLNPIFDGVRAGYWENDPTFPVRPSRKMIEPIANFGPDADSFRGPKTGRIKDGSALGRPVKTFTAHRSPLGLVFDRARALSPEFRGDGFMLSWTTGDPDGDSVPGPFGAAGQDLLHLDLSKSGVTYTLHATRIVEGFNNPIDAEIIGNTIYVLDYNGTQSIWEVTLPK